MHMRCVRAFHRWTEPRLIPALLLGVLMSAAPSSAQSPPALPTVGAGVQTSYVHTSPEDGDDTDTFPLNSVRLYVSGSAAPKIKFMFNTEYDGATTTSACSTRRRSSSCRRQFNIWVGRFLPPSDRANLYGPYYAHHWARLHRRRPGRLSVRLRRAATTASCTGASSARSRCRAASSTARRRPATSTVIGAGRVQVDFWDPEGGYYLNGTYYGDKNLLAVGVAGQVQGERQVGLERRLPAREEGAGRRRVHGREPSARSTTSSAATTRSYGDERRRLRPGQLTCFRKRWA